MFEENPRPKRHQIIKSKILGLSLKRDDNFIRNLVLSFAVIFVWVGVWTLTDKYLIRNTDLGSLFSILVGILLLFLVDGDISQLGGGSTKKED